MTLRAAIDATPLFGARTGVGRFTDELIHHLSTRADVELVGYAVTWRAHGDLGSLLPPTVRATTRKMAAAPLRALWRRGDHPRIERWTGAIDVVHGTNFVVPPARAATVSTVHDLTFMHHPELCTADVLEYPALLRRAIAAGCWIHTVSSFVGEEVVDMLGVDPERVVTVPLGITPAPSHDGGRGRRLAGSDRYVLALGTIEPRKNLPVLIDAFELLAAEDPDLHLVVAGPDGWGVEAFEESLGRARHADRIVRLGFIGEVDRGDLMAGAGAVAVPSLYEGFGLTAAEAMLAGTPVVASDVGSHREVVGDGGLLVPPTDRDALAGALSAVLTDPDRAADLRRRGAIRARLYTWEATAEGVVELWRRALGVG